MMISSPVFSRPASRRILLIAVGSTLSMLLLCYSLVLFTIIERQQGAGRLFLRQVINELNHRIDYHHGNLSSFQVMAPTHIRNYQLFVFAPDGRSISLNSEQKPINTQLPNWSLHAGQDQLILQNFSSFEGWSSLNRNYRLYVRAEYTPVYNYFNSPVYLLPLVWALILTLIVVIKLRQRHNDWYQLLQYVQQMPERLNREYQPLRLSENIVSFEMRQMNQLVNRLAFKMSQYFQQNKEQRHRQYALIDNAPVALFLINRKGNLLYFNEQFAYKFRTPFDKNVVYMLSDFITGKDKATQQLLTQLKNQHLYMTLLVTSLQNDNQFELHLNPFYNHLGQHKGFSGVLQLVTRYEEQLHAAWLEDKQKTEQLSSFNRLWAVLGHELRTPLNGMMGMIELLLNDKSSLNQEQQENIMTLHQSSKAMLQMLNDMLDLAKLDAGKLQSNISAVNLLHLLQKVSSLMAGSARHNRISFYLFTDPYMPWYFDSDDGRLTQILLNLLSNAIKFTKQGYVALIVDKIDSTDSIIVKKYANPTSSGFDIPFDWLRLTVKDSGIGISEKDQQKLFSYFNQANDSISRRFGGTGLGLAISNNFAKLLGGFIHLESEPNVGSEFQVYLPLSKFSLQPVFDFRFSNLKIFFIVISPFEVVQLINRFFVYMDIPALVITEIDEQSLEKINAIKPLNLTRVFLVDDEAFLPHRGFFERIPSFNTSIRLLVSIDSEKFIPLSVLLNFDAVIQKPLTLSNIFAEVTRLYEQRFSDNPRQPQQNAETAFRAFLQKRAALMGMSLETQSATDSPSVSNPTSDSTNLTPNFANMSACPRRFTHILLAEDNLVNQKVTKKLVEKLGFQVIIANNGKEAVQILQQHRQQIGLVLMDCQMPIMDGFEATRRIRVNQDSIPIVALTANDTTEDRLACTAAGMDNFLTKPINREAFARLLNHYAR